MRKEIKPLLQHCCSKRLLFELTACFEFLKAGFCFLLIENGQAGTLTASYKNRECLIGVLQNNDKAILQKNQQGELKMKKKQITALILTVLLALTFCACGSSKETAENKETGVREELEEKKEKVELIVFAAASMTETLTELGKKYMAENDNITIQFNFDSSGTLKTQIQEGADCDVFISAGQKQMNQLDIEADPAVNTEGLDFVLKGSRFDILENKVALAVPEDNPAAINTYDDMVAGLKSGSIMLAMGNSDVPVGQYTQKILKFYDLNEEELAAVGSITYGSNVKEVTTQVSEATVDCGIIYQTDAFSAGLAVVDTATAQMCGQVVYPAAVMNISKQPEAAVAFLEYLTGDTANEVFKNVGFTPVKK